MSIICRGSLALGNACGRCSRCKHEATAICDRVNRLINDKRYYIHPLCFYTTKGQHRYWVIFNDLHGTQNRLCNKQQIISMCEDVINAHDLFRGVKKIIRIIDVYDSKDVIINIPTIDLI